MIGAEILSIIQNIVSVALVASGLVFVLAGAVGVLRLPDFYTRLHAARQQPASFKEPQEHSA